MWGAVVGVGQRSKGKGARVVVLVFMKCKHEFVAARTKHALKPRYVLYQHPRPRIA